MAWMIFDNMLFERTQTQRPHVILFDLYEISTIDKYLKTESRLVHFQGLGGERIGITTLWI